MTDSKVVEGVRLPSSRALTENELAWITFIRLATCESDPAPTLWGVQMLQKMFKLEVR